MQLAAAGRKEKLSTVAVAFHFMSFNSRAIEFGLWSLITLKFVFSFLSKCKGVGCLTNFSRHRSNMESKTEVTER